MSNYRSTDHLSGHRDRAALVTGASSGFGLEAASQLADTGDARVTITARTDDKAEAARADLGARGRIEVFDTLTLDLDDLESVGRHPHRPSPADHAVARRTPVVRSRTHHHRRPGTAVPECWDPRTSPVCGLGPP